MSETGGGIIDVLAAKIGKWLDHKSHSMMVLSSRTGVSYPTIRRIAKQECQLTGSDTAMAILEVIEPDKQEIKRIMNKYFRMGDILEGNPVLDIGRENLILEAMNNVLKWQILGMCDIAQGIPESSIVERFGQEGQRILKELISGELIVKDANGNLKARDNMWMPNSWRTFVKMAISSLSLISDNSIESRMASIFHHSEGLNLEGIEALKQNELKKIAEDKKILSDPKYHGPIGMFIISSIAPFDSSAVCKKG